MFIITRRDFIRQALWLLLLCTCIGFASCKGPSQKLYEGKDYRLSYPSDWGIVENVDTMSDVYIGSKNQMFGFTVVRFETDMSLDEIDSMGREGLSHAGFVVDNNIVMKVAGATCHKTKLKANVGGVDVQQVSYSFKHHNIFYNLKFGNVMGSKEYALADTIVSSFRFK